MKKHLINLLTLTLCVATLNSHAGNGNSQGNPTGLKMISSFLIASNGYLADGNRVVFGAQYSNSVDGYDAMKMTNPGENFGLFRDGKFLAVEARQPLSAGDTIFYRMTNSVNQTYQLVIVPGDLANEGLKGILIDRYTNTRQEISLADTNRVNIGVNADPDSKNPGRLMLVFATSGTLPIKFSGIAAVNDENRAVNINWKVEQEINIDRYEIERSSDGINFTSLAQVAAKYRGQASGTYTYRDENPIKAANFYRIKSYELSGKVIYSSIVKANIFTVAGVITMYPNPVKGNIVKLQFNQADRGNYSILIANNIGQVVHRSSLKINDANYTHTLTLGSAISKGNYTVCVFDQYGKVNTQTLIIQ